VLALLRSSVPLVLDADALTLLAAGQSMTLRGALARSVGRLAC
jgi:NAD(P)H-hydrate repair Nnr-like enzyme with NAD(P)H-hydrate dehydratase domain